jgi:hypothetical protein
MKGCLARWSALTLLAFFSYVGDNLGLTITGPLFNIS